MKHHGVINGFAKVGQPNEVEVGLLKALSQPGAVLVLSKAMDKAAIIAGTGSGEPKQLATLTREQAERFEEMGWIQGTQQGQISRYHLTPQIKKNLQSFYAQQENRAFSDMFEADFAEDTDGQKGTPKARVSRMETPLLALARRKDKSGKPFLSKELVRAGDRLREDFESAHIGPNICQNWNSFMTGPTREKTPGSADKIWNAEERVTAALAELGPGLGDVAVSCCCHLEGLETVEKKMGWSARSAKIVLKIALERLKCHYERVGDVGDMIG